MYVLQSIPIHLLSALSPPKNILKQIQKFDAIFFWGMENDKAKYHRSSWQNLSFPVSEGGINFKTMEDVCQSMEYKQW